MQRSPSWKIDISLWRIVFLLVVSWSSSMLSAYAYQGGYSCRQRARLAFLQWNRNGLQLQGRRSTSVALQAADNDPSLRERLSALEQEIRNLNDGQSINVNSPKQVATAIFGKVQSTSRDILQQAAEGMLKDLDSRSQQLAALVLQYRELSKKSTSSSSSTRHPTPTRQRKPFSTLSNTTVNGNSLLEPLTAKRMSQADDSLQSNAVNDGSPSTLFQTDEMSTYVRQVESLFGAKSKIHDYWKEPLLQVTRPSARALVSQLDSSSCPMGYNPLAVPHDPLRGRLSESTSMTTAGKKGSFLAYCRDQKEKYPDCIILTRCGDFYETFGIDAIMLVEHCGLNPMGSKAKAGCPYRNVQATVDCLTEQGFRVAVYEEAADTDSSTGAGASGGSKSRIKSRFLAQIVSSASPTYLYDLVLLGNADTLVTAPPSRPYVGILSLASGYTLVEISIEERSVRVSERLTAEAVACRLAAYPPADPLFYVPSPGEYESNDGILSLPFLPSRKDASDSGPGARLRLRIIPPSLVEEVDTGVDDVERARKTIVSALLQLVESQEDDVPTQRRATLDDFTLVSSEANITASTRTNPLYVETATQLGLMNDRAIPSLVSYILPDSAPAATRRFLRRFLLTPPPPQVGDAMASLVSFLKESGSSLPPLSIPPVGKVLALLRAGQASAQVYSELLRAMDAVILLLDSFTDEPALIDSLMILLEHESGLAADPSSLRSRCLNAMEAVEDVISPLHHAQADPNVEISDQITEFGDLIPKAFFERNEAPWRGRIRQRAAPDSYAAVEHAAERLAEAIANDYYGTSLSECINDQGSPSRIPIMQDIFNNLIALKEIPKGFIKAEKEKFIHPRDRNGKLLRNRYTTERVETALSDYVSACDRACQDVASVLVGLSQMLYEEGHIPAVVQASHANLILSSAFHHAVQANRLGWNMAHTYEGGSNIENSCDFKDVWPYWMDRSEAVANSFEMSGMWLLSAPNMSGKSTLMRSTAAAALLSVCGLCAPLNIGSSVRRFDHIFVRGASADVPTEQKSAFGAEMGDIAALLRCCGEKSLVFVDELGRGTSPHDGTRLAGAVLEAMAVSGMSGIFATHLHGIFELPLEANDRIVKKRMAIHERDESGHESARYTWTYRLEDGVCTDSMALVTAARFGLPSSVLERAEVLGSFISHSSVHSTLRDKNGKTTTARPRQTPRVAEIVRIVEDTTGKQCLSIPPFWNAPASLDGKSCVYVLELDDGAPQYYVGETDNLRQRLNQHRSKKGKWTNLSALALPAEGKSQARAWESQLIQRLAKAGIPLASQHDGRSIKSAQSN